LLFYKIVQINVLRKNIFNKFQGINKLLVRFKLKNVKKIIWLFIFRKDFLFLNNDERLVSRPIEGPMLPQITTKRCVWRGRSCR
jgi:hypothetical protein